MIVSGVDRHIMKVLTDAQIRYEYMKMKHIRGEIIGILIIVIGVFAIMTPGVHASEITPDPSTYSYGSTSEFSQSKDIQHTSTGVLANTGQNYVLLMFVCLALGGVASLLLLRKVLNSYRG